MTVDVYHRTLEALNRDPATAYRSRPDVTWTERRGGYQHTATVHVDTADVPDALDLAFDAMQHEPGSSSPSAERVDLHHEDPRPCSVGDVLVVDGHAFEVQAAGFSRI